MKKKTSNVQTDRHTSATNVTSIVAWVVSIGVHVGLGGLAFLITWSVIQVADEPPPLITATWHEQTNQPMAAMPSASDPVLETSIALPPLPTPPPREIVDGLAVIDQATSSKIPTLARREIATEAKFMGLEAVSARNIVYVVDASGSMLMHLSTVVRSLEQSLYDLNKKQSFAILFFQKNHVIHVPPKKLMPATASNIKQAMNWIRSSDHVIPTGRSNPTKAIARAMRLNPDLVYLLSENIRGAGQYEVSPEQLLASLDLMNPVDKTNGRRRVRINCIEFLSSDPANTMRRIAEEHGGIDGYTFIDPVQ